MSNTFETGFSTTLAAKLNAADTTATLATVPTITAGRLLLKSGSTKEWIDYTGVSGSTVTGLTRGLSKTANPATSGTGLTWVAGTRVVLVAMHDQLGDKQQGYPPLSRTSAQLSTRASDGTITKILGERFWDSTQGADVRWTGAAYELYGTASVANATTTSAGKLEIATQSEFDAGTDTGSVGPLSAPVSYIQKQINTATAKTTIADADKVAIADSAASWVIKSVTWANLKTQLNKNAIGGTGADWAIGAGALTITWSNNTLIVKNYTSFAPWANTVTITPTWCVLYIKVSGDCDLTGTTFNFSWKWWQGGAAAVVVDTAGSTGSNFNRILNSVVAAWGAWAKSLVAPAPAGWASNATAGLPMASLKYARTIQVSGGAGGGGGGFNNSGVPGAGGNWGGCLILEVGGTLTLSGTTMNFNGTAGWNASGAGVDNASGGGGGGGGSVYALYNAISWSVTPNVSWGAGGSGAAGGQSGTAWADGEYVFESYTEFN